MLCFSTLHIAILYDKLIKVLLEIVDFSFEGDDKQFLTVENMVQDGWKKTKSFREIYSPELELKKENDISAVGSFLDLCVKIR